MQLLGELGVRFRLSAPAPWLGEPCWVRIHLHLPDSAPEVGEKQYSLQRGGAFSWSQIQIGVLITA